MLRLVAVLVVAWLCFVAIATDYIVERTLTSWRDWGREKEREKGRGKPRGSDSREESDPISMLIGWYDLGKRFRRSLILRFPCGSVAQFNPKDWQQLGKRRTYERVYTPKKMRVRCLRPDRTPACNKIG